MPNVGAVLKSEIARVARKQIRVELEGVRKAVQSQRAAVKVQRDRLESLERQVAAMRLSLASGASEPVSADRPPRRFSASRFRAMRVRLELSAAQCAAILGVTAQTVYAWERGTSRPAPAMLESIAVLRGMGKRELVARLEALQ